MENIQIVLNLINQLFILKALFIFNFNLDFSYFIKF